MTAEPLTESMVRTVKTSVPWLEETPPDPWIGTSELAVVTPTEGRIMTTPRPDRLLTLADWDALPEDNSRRYELVEGELHIMPRPAINHQAASLRIGIQLQPQLQEDRWLVLPDSEVVINSHHRPTIRVPDLAVIPVKPGDRRPRFDASEAALVLEIISPSSVHADRMTKYDEYEKAGIGRYWIINLDDPATLTAYRLVDGKYEIEAAGTGPVTIEFEGQPLTLNVGKLTF